MVCCLVLIKGSPGGLPTGKNYAPERTRLESVAGFNTAECNAEPPPGVRALLITLNPAPGKFNALLPPTLPILCSHCHSSTHQQLAWSMPINRPCLGLSQYTNGLSMQSAIPHLPTVIAGFCRLDVYLYPFQQYACFYVGLRLLTKTATWLVAEFSVDLV